MRSKIGTVKLTEKNIREGMSEADQHGEKILAHYKRELRKVNRGEVSMETFKLSAKPQD